MGSRSDLTRGLKVGCGKSGRIINSRDLGASSSSQNPRTCAKAYAANHTRKNRGYIAIAYDVRHTGLDGAEDIMSDAGIIFALTLILRLNPAGLAWFGIVCSSWVWMCRWSTGRWRDVLGNRTDNKFAKHFFVAHV